MVKVDIGGESLTLLPLTLGQLRGGILDKLRENDKLINEGNSWGALLLQGEVIMASLKRSYPERSEAEWLDLLTVENIPRLFLAVLGVSGFPQGAEEPAGTASGTSAPSTSPSPAPTGGATA